jgi:hypothetical protein
VIPGSWRRLAAAGLMLWAARAVAAENPPIEPGRPPEWGIAVGYGLPIHSPGRPAEEHQVALEASGGFRLGDRFEYLAAVNGYQYLTPTGYFVGLLPAGIRFTIGHGGIHPHASLQLGLGWTDLTELVEISRRFNFQFQVGMGLRGRVTEKSAWTVDVLYAHISNAGTVYPNLGLNAVLLLGGWRFR